MLTDKEFRLLKERERLAYANNMPEHRALLRELRDEENARRFSLPEDHQWSLCDA